MASAETVKVIVRCRPMNRREKDLKCKCAVVMEGLVCSLQLPDEGDTGPKNFTFDGAYHTDSTTEGIYNDVAFPLVESVLEGYNGTVFAYGQTGCGKSFTMQGVSDPPTQRGIIPRAFEHIFEVIQTTENMKYLVLASYLEIYNEEIRDLLGTEVKKKLDLKEHPDKGVYVQGLSQHPVHNTGECEELMVQGWKNRSTGSTLMNAESSRSHSIFTITLEMLETAGDSDAIRSGKLNLVDLAGSERQAKTGATGDRLKEANKINLSLSALGNVISALVDGKSKHIPYRDSKLTRLLQDSLGGNTKTLMVACLSPADNNYDETLSTLRYANRAKNIKNKPKVNEDPKDAMLREYQEEIRKLKDMLDKKGPQETKDGSRVSRGTAQVVSVAPDETVLQEEREKVRQEYEEHLKQVKQDMMAEQQNNQVLQQNMEELRKQYEQQIEEIKKKEEEQQALHQEQLQQQQQQQQLQHQQQQTLLGPAGTTTTMTLDAKDDSFYYEDDFEADDEGVTIPGHAARLLTPAANVPGGAGTTRAFLSVSAGRKNNTPTAGTAVNGGTDMTNTMQNEALKRLKELQEKMVGGEKTQDSELKAKRTRRKKYMEKRMKILSEALKNVDDEDGIMIKVYDDIHEELRVKTDLAKTQKSKIKSMEKEIKDLTSEFQEERTDYLETIRRQEQQMKLLGSILEKVQPTIRRDCNYSNLDSVKKEALWEDEYQRWKVPDLLLVKTKLPPAGPTTSNTGTLNQSDFLVNNKYSNSFNSSSNSNSNFSPTNRVQPGGRFPSQTAPARLGMWDDDDDDKILKQKLQKSEMENVAGNYFKPKKRANELLVRFQDEAVSPGKTNKSKKNTSTTSNQPTTTNNLFNQSLSQSMWASNSNNNLNLSSSFNNSSGSYNSSWGSNSSTSSLNGGGGGGGGSGEGGVMSNGWLGNGFASISPEMSMRRPNRLEALPTIDKRSRKKSKDVLHTLDLI